MPIQSSSILKNTGPKQDLKYWAWNNVSSSSNRKYLAHPNGEDSFILSNEGISRVGLDGRIVWTRPSYVGSSIDAALDSSGNIYVLDSNGPVIKYDISGAYIWGKSLDTNGTFYPYAITVGSAGNVYIVGKDNNEGVLIKLTSSGGHSWSRKVLNTVFFEEVSADEAVGRVYVGGFGNSNGVLIGFDTNGTIQWQKSLGSGTNSGYVTGVQAVSNSVYVIFRGAYNNGMSIIFKYSSGGSFVDVSGGVYGAVGYNISYGGLSNFKIDQSNGNFIITYAEGTVRKYTSGFSSIAGGKFVSNYGRSADVDTDGNIYVQTGNIYAKLKGDMSGAGIYGSMNYSATAGGSHSLNNGYQYFQATSSFSISSFSSVSTALSILPIFGTAPTGEFIIIRTK